MINKIVIFICLFALFLIPGYGILTTVWKPISDQLEKNEKLERSLTAMVPMRDGIRLATDVYFPDGEGPWPVILVRTRYNKRHYNPITYLQGFPLELMQNGYAFVTQDTRGRCDSEGIDRIYQSDGWGLLQDGYDTCSWITNQPWCNGKIGTMGNSASGVLQCSLAPSQPPGLVCQVIGFAPGDFYEDWAFTGDVPRNLWKHWLEGQNGLWLYGEGFNHVPRDNWWDMYNFTKVAHLVTIPALHIGGWYDMWTEGTIRRFKSWQEKGGNGAKGNQRIIIGPWSHSVRTNVIGCDNFQIKNLPKWNFMVSDFFDYWLKDSDNGISDEPPVIYWGMKPPGKCEKGGWHKKSDFPTTQTHALYLNKNKALTDNTPEEKSIFTFVYDPANPFETLGGSTYFLNNEGPQDISPALDRKNHLLLKTSPLTKKISITGEIECVLYLESDAPCSDISAVVVDILPDGQKIILADGIKRIKWSESTSINLPITTPGSAVHVTIGWACYTFLPGHRVGLVISGGNWPRFERNPQNGKIHFSLDGARIASNTIYYGEKKASRLLLPVVPSG